MQQTTCPNILNLHCQTSTHTFSPSLPLGCLGSGCVRRKTPTMEVVRLQGLPLRRRPSRPGGGWVEESRRAESVGEPGAAGPGNQ